MPSDDHARFDFTRNVVKRFASEEAAQGLAQKEPSLALTIENALIITVEDLLHRHPLPTTCVNGAAELTNQLRPFFNEFFLSHLSDAAFNFDNLTGESEESVSTMFFATESPTSWLFKIAYAMAAAAERAADSNFNPRRTHTSAAISETAPERASPRQTTQADNLATTAPTAATTSPDPTPLVSCPIVDITLVGPTIKSAWNSNALTRSMEQEAAAPVIRNPAWTPGDSILPYYHGTTSPELGTMPAYAQHEVAINITYSDATPQVLQGMVTRNQMVPTHSTLPVIYTGFSPLRCVLWALFHSDVISNIPTASSTIHYLAFPWDCPRRPPAHHHRGVRLLKFCPDPARMSTISTFILPNGRQQEWIRQVSTIGVPPHNPLSTSNGGPTATLWALFSNFHRQPADTPWPSILHCYEGDQQVRMLKYFTKQLWRTIWHDRDSRILNDGLRMNMAISFTITNPADPAGKERKGEDGKQESL